MSTKVKSTIPSQMIGTSYLASFKVKHPETGKFVRLDLHHDLESNQIVGFEKNAIESAQDRPLRCPFSEQDFYDFEPCSPAVAMTKAVTPPEVFDNIVALAAFRHAVHRHGPHITTHVVSYVIQHWPYFGVQDKCIIAEEITESLAAGEHQGEEKLEWERILLLPML